MQKDKKATTVIFRRFRDGDIIAMFPYEIEDYNGHINSYMHVGQHSSASLDLIPVTNLATPEQYADLKAELESLGYLLDIKKRMSYKMWNEARRTACI